MWLVIVFWLVLGGVREVREVTDRVACLAACMVSLLLAWGTGRAFADEEIVKVIF